MQRRGEHIVERGQIARGGQARSVEQARMLRQLGGGLGLHGAQEHAGVDLPVEAAPDGAPAGRQIERRANRRHGANALRCGVTRLAGPAQQRIAAQRHADRQQRAAAAGLLTGVKALQQPVDLGPVARVVGTRRAVQLARAAAKVRHGKTQPVRARPTGKRLGVVAARRAFQAVEQHQQRPGRLIVVRRLQPIHIDKVAVGRVPALAPPGDGRAHHAPRVQRRPDGLQLAAGQPGGGAVGNHFKNNSCSRLSVRRWGHF